MHWFFYHAFKQLFPSGRWVSFYLYVDCGGHAWSLRFNHCASVMNGFGEGIRSRIVEAYGDIRIQSSHLIDDWESTFAEVAALPEGVGLGALCGGCGVIAVR